MKTISVDIDKLTHPEKNVRIHTERQIEEFIRSLDMFGQIRPAVVDENNTILVGNGMIIAMRRRGDKKVDVLSVEGLTENQKKKLMMADNKIFNLGIEDLDNLNAFLEEMRDDLDIPGYDEDTLKSLVAAAEDVTEKLSEYGTIDESDIKAIKANGERKKDLIAKAEDNTAVSDLSDDMNTSEVHEFVVCPRCGEKICL